MQFVGDIGRPLRLVYFVLGILLIVGAWVTHDVISIWQIAVLVVAGAFLLWIARAGRCEACATLPANGMQKNKNGEF